MSNGVKGECIITLSCKRKECRKINTLETFEYFKNNEVIGLATEMLSFVILVLVALME